MHLLGRIEHAQMGGKLKTVYQTTYYSFINKKIALRNKVNGLATLSSQFKFF